MWSEMLGALQVNCSDREKESEDDNMSTEPMTQDQMILSGLFVYLKCVPVFKIQASSLVLDLENRRTSMNMVNSW